MVIPTVQEAIIFLSRDENVIPSYFDLLNYLEQVIKVFGVVFSLL